MRSPKTLTHHDDPDAPTSARRTRDARHNMAYLCSFIGYKPSKSEWPWHLPFKVNVKCKQAFGLPIYAFLVMFNSNIWPNSAPLRHIKLQNLSDFDLSRSLWMKCDSVIGPPPPPPKYAFLLMFNINTWPNFAPLRDMGLLNFLKRKVISLPNLSDLYIYLSRSR